MDPEGGRPGRPTHLVRHICSGNLGIVKILRYIRSDMLKKIKKKIGRKMPPPPPLGNAALYLSTPKHNGNSGTDHAPYTPKTF